MLIALVHMSIALHGIATAFFLVYPLRFRPEILKIAIRILWVAVLLQGGVIALVVAGGSSDRADLPNMQLFSMAFAIALAYLLSTLWRQISLLGTFLVPVSTAIFLALLFAPVAGKPADAPSILGVVKYVHIGGCVAGFMAFTVSVAAAFAYLLRDYSLRTKRGPSIIDRLPPLTRLERLSYRSLVVGFPLYTLGLLLGTVWLGETMHNTTLKPQVLFSLGSWVVFALLLQIYVASGWRGARAATLNMVGYLLIFLAVLIYALRGG
jgi:ABC-type uncharacterized transport system permease subunit